MRQNLYNSILTKHIGWHDKRENGSGILSVILSKETDKLDAVATESTAITIESIFAVFTGLLFGFIYCW